MPRKALLASAGAPSTLRADAPALRRGADASPPLSPGGPCAGRILRQPAVADRTGLSRSSIYQRVKEGRFPAPVTLGDRAVGWLESEIDAWIAERISARRGAA